MYFTDHYESGFVHSFICSFTQLLFHSLIHSFIQSHTYSLKNTSTKQ